MAVTVQMQFESAVTEMYEEAFVGSAIENGTTMIIFLTFRTPQTVIKYIFLMVFWPRRGHNHRRIDVSQQEQGARVPRGSEVCRSYHPLSRRTPSTICPLSKPTPINLASSA